MKSKNYAIYAMKIRKANMPFVIKSETIVITPENLEELLIANAI